MLLFRKRNRLFFRILSYFLSLLIPVILIGGGTFVYIRYMTVQDFSEKIDLNLRASIASMDRQIKTVQDVCMNLMYDSLIEEVFTVHIPGDQTSKFDLYQIPKTIARSQNILGSSVKNLFLYGSDLLVFNFSGMSALDSYFGQFHVYQDYDTAYWKQKLEAQNYIEFLPVTVCRDTTYQEDLVLPVAMSNPLAGYRVVLGVDLSVQEIGQFFQQSSILPSSLFYITDNNNQMIYASASLPQDMEAMLAGINADTVSWDGNDYYVNQSKSELYGWNYYEFTPMEALYENIHGILLMIVLLCLLFLVAGVLFSLRFSTNIYNPIKSLMDAAMDSGVPEGATKNVFQVLKSGVETLTDRKSEETNQTQKLADAYLEMSFLAILQGQKLQKKGLFLNKLREFTSLHGSSYVCCAIHFEFLDTFHREFQDVDRLDFFSRLKGVIFSFFNRGIDSYVLERPQNTYLVIMSLSAEQEIDDVRRWAEELIEIFAYDIRYCNLQISIGTTCKELDGLAVSYQNAAEALTQCKPGESFQIVIADGTPEAGQILYSPMDSELLLDLLEQKDIPGLETCVGQIYKKNNSRPLAKLNTALYQTGLQFLRKSHLDEKKILMPEDHPFFTVLKEGMEGTETSKRILLEFYQRIVHSYRRSTSPNSNAMASLLVAYVEENYRKDLYMEKIAEELDVSPKYLSQIFRQVTGKSLMDYISIVRIGHVKDLLLNSDLKINDIADQTGFQSRTTFIRIFKKFEGKTPSEFRKEHLGHSVDD